MVPSCCDYLGSIPCRCTILQPLLITGLILEGLQSPRTKSHFRKEGEGGGIGRSNGFLKGYLFLKMYLLLINLCSVIALIDSCLKAV